LSPRPEKRATLGAKGDISLATTKTKTGGGKTPAAKTGKGSAMGLNNKSKKPAKRG
jgi:hypothetical protein